MNVETIVRQLQEHRDKLTEAITALERGGSPKRGPGRPKKRVMSADARRRIGLAMKKRWAERKRGAKVA